MCLHCRDQPPASRCTASAYPLSSNHLERNCRRKAHVNLIDINVRREEYERQVGHLAELLLCKCQVPHYEGHTERVRIGAVNV